MVAEVDFVAVVLVLVVGVVLKVVVVVAEVSIYNVICWFAGPMGQTTHRPSV